MVVGTFCLRAKVNTELNTFKINSNPRSIDNLMLQLSPKSSVQRRNFFLRLLEIQARNMKVVQVFELHSRLPNYLSKGDVQ